MVRCAKKMLGPQDSHFLHKKSYDLFYRHYYFERERRRPSSQLQSDKIRLWFLSGSKYFFRYKCPVKLQSELKNEVMVILNCMIRSNFVEYECLDRYTGKKEIIDDSGSLLHLAIKLRAPADVIKLLIDDSCGLALNVKGRYRSECEGPPFSLLENSKGRRFHIEGLQTMVYLGVKYMWCLPFLYKWSVWTIVQQLAIYPHPTFRRTSDILMDYKLPYDPVIKHALKFDRTLALKSSKTCIKAAFDLWSIDQGGTGTTTITRIVHLCKRDNLFDPIYLLIREDPGSFIQSVRPQMVASLTNLNATTQNNNTEELPETFEFHADRVQEENQDSSDEGSLNEWNRVVDSVPVANEDGDDPPEDPLDFNGLDETSLQERSFLRENGTETNSVDVELMNTNELEDDESIIELE